MSEHIADAGKMVACPFCGAEVSWIRIGAAYRVACRCGAEGPAYHTEAAAIAAWNQRAGDDEATRLRAEVERLDAIGRLL